VPVRPRTRNDNDGDSDEEDPYRVGGVEKKSFRFNARSAFLTYPHCPVCPERYLAGVSFLPSTIKCAFGKTETHADGALHLHVWITFQRKIDTINPRFFDITIPPTDEHKGASYHCNIRHERKHRSGISNHARAWEYLCKYDGKVPTDIVGTSNLYPTSKNFRKEYGDRTQWLNYLAVSAMPLPQFPILLPDGSEVPEPDGKCKQRHLWIHGPPNSGKTKWLEENVYQFKNYKVSGELYPYDNYDGQQIIVYDDIPPNASDLLSITNTSATLRAVPGQTRYNVRWVPGGTVTLVIICNNFNIDDFFSAASPVTRDAIHTRFLEIRMDEN
jgi:hypothetical protein